MSRLGLLAAAALLLFLLTGGQPAAANTGVDWAAPLATGINQSLDGSREYLIERQHDRLTEDRREAATQQPLAGNGRMEAPDESAIPAINDGSHAAYSRFPRSRWQQDE